MFCFVVLGWISSVGRPRLGRPSSKLCVATWNVKPYFLTQRLYDRLHGDIADDFSAKLTRPSLSLSELGIASLFVRMIKLTIICVRICLSVVPRFLADAFPVERYDCPASSRSGNRLILGEKLNRQNRRKDSPRLRPNSRLYYLVEQASHLALIASSMLKCRLCPAVLKAMYALRLFAVRAHVRLNGASLTDEPHQRRLLHRCLLLQHPDALSL